MFTEDLSAFFKTAEHAVDALIGVTTVAGIFDRPSADALSIGSTRPRFTCATADLPAGYKTANIVIAGTTFLVAGAPNVDETGGVTTLELKEQ